MIEETLFPDITTAAERKAAKRDPEPRFLYQSMGAGVQSTTIALLAANGAIPKPRYAVFADTGWEPPGVYTHLDKLDAEVLKPAGIELVRVQQGNLFDDTMSRFMPRVLPLYTREPESGKPRGLTKRACTSNYKLGPIFRWIREQLGAEVREAPCKHCGGTGERHAPWLVKDGQEDTLGPCSVCRGTGIKVTVGPAPGGAWAQAYVGFSSDEIYRVGRSHNQLTSDLYPLIDLGMNRQDCIRYLNEQRWTDVAKSACIGCPFRNNAEWLEIRADEKMWAEAVAVDEAVRRLPMMEFDAFLHKDRVPLPLANIGQIEAEEEDDDEATPSCSPYGCRSGDPIDMPLDLFGDFDDDEQVAAGGLNG